MMYAYPRYLILLPLMAALGGCNSSSSSSGDAAAPTVESSAGREFGEPTDSQIRPGVRISSSYGSCTSNFIFAANDVTYYIGTAAHCFSEDANNGDPCEARNAPGGFSDITIENARRKGRLVYSSWSAMQQQGQKPGSSLCQLNDFALVQIHVDDLDNVHPAALRFGGPTGLYTGTALVGDDVFTYGRSSLHLGQASLEEKRGRITEIVEGGLAYRVRTDTAGVPGDSGSAVLHEDGRALAILADVGVGVGPAPVSNGVVNLERALAYAKNGGFIPASTTLLVWPEFNGQ